jgi:hypothetical protein
MNSATPHSHRSCVSSVPIKRAITWTPQPTHHLKTIHHTSSTTPPFAAGTVTESGLTNKDAVLTLAFRFTIIGYDAINEEITVQRDFDIRYHAISATRAKTKRRTTGPISFWCCRICIAFAATPGLTRTQLRLTARLNVLQRQVLRLDSCGVTNTLRLDAEETGLP